MDYVLTKDMIAEEHIERLETCTKEVERFWEEYFSAAVPGENWTDKYDEISNRLSMIRFCLRTITDKLMAAYDMPPEWFEREMKTLLDKGQQ